MCARVKSPMRPSPRVSVSSMSRFRCEKIEMETDFLTDWLRNRPRNRGVICDIDDTLCVQFDQPILIACQTLAVLDRSVQVHYVTARPEASRQGTEKFIVDQRLPGWKNLHFCPSFKSTRLHKAEVMARLVKEFTI